MLDTTSKQPVFIAFQANNETLPIIDAIECDNPEAIVNHLPAMVKIDCPGKLVIKRESVEERLGREFDLQEIHINMISLGGEIDETDEEFVIFWQ